MKLKRSAGIILHPTSLPGKYGIGDFGKSAFDFIDFLKKSNQRLWQVLPLTPTSFGDSPYQSFSTFAGNSLLLSPEELIKEGYLTDDISVPNFDPESIDYGHVIAFKEGLFRTAFENFKIKATESQIEGLQKFITQNSYWLKEFTLFISVKNYFINKRKSEGFSQQYEKFKKKSEKLLDENQINDYYFGGAWISWPEDILMREPAAIKEYVELLKADLEYYAFLQYEFSRQWSAVKKYANENGISIIGDIPIFVAYDSADCWANKELYFLSESGFPIDVAGVPPDYFSETGQLWGNPLYNWTVCEKTGFDWWIRRIKKTSETVDYVRIDHFRGFDTYWAVPFGEKTAVNGEWRIGPRTKLFDAIIKELGDVPIIAEDLGDMFDSVYVLKDHFNFPGMKILQFAFDTASESAYLPHNYENDNCIVYTGTHDNNTTVGWFAEASEEAKDFLRRYLDVDGSNVSWNMIKLAYSSIAAFAVIPFQDCLSLGAEARLNIPGVAAGNWKWRYTEEMLKEYIPEGLSYYVNMFGREGSDKIKEVKLAPVEMEAYEKECLKKAKEEK